MQPNTKYLNRTPNKDARSPSVDWIGVVWHGTGGNPANPESTLRYNLRPDVKSSYHDLIAADGEWWQYLDPDQFLAWHAGVSRHEVAGTTYRNYGINERFLAVELDERNTGDPITTPQLDTAARLALHYRDRYGIPLAEPYHVTHKQIAPGRKIDPTCTTIAAILHRARQLDISPSPVDDYEQAWGNAVPYRPDWGIPARWRHELQRGNDLGAAVTDEITVGGRQVQAFTHGLIIYRAGVTAVVRI